MTNERFDHQLHCNGVDGATGTRAIQPTPTLADIARFARQCLSIPGVPGPGPSTRSPSDPGFAAVFSNLEEMGWGVIFAKDTPNDVRRALAPLLELRQGQAVDLYKEFSFDPATDSFRHWLTRHGLSPGNFDETKVPFYLLLVGHPATIPFEFQYLLDIDYAVGRLDFHSAAEYAFYAESVCVYERAGQPLQAREVVLWGPNHDEATALSTEMLLQPLALEGAPNAAIADGRGGNRRNKMPSYATTLHTNEQATKARLLDTLHRPSSRLPPAMLFTASHGVCWPKGHPRQATTQGALLSQDWAVGEPVKTDHCLAAPDISDDARIHGVVSFFFGCFTAGTPEEDTFPCGDSNMPTTLAIRPFLSPLPRRLLAHPGGGALAVIGHVDRAWGYSIRPLDSQTQIQPFRTCLRTIMSGLPIGLATTDFSRRFAALSSHLLGVLDERRRTLLATSAMELDEQLTRAWIERNDAQSYVLLGDPATRLRPELLA